MPHDRPAAGHRVRLALVGFGYWGPNYARVLNDLPDAELTAVCDRSADRRIEPELSAPSLACVPDRDHALGYSLRTGPRTTERR